MATSGTTQEQPIVRTAVQHGEHQMTPAVNGLPSPQVQSIQVQPEHMSVLQMQGQENLKASVLVSRLVKIQKQIIGERLFPLVQEYNDFLADKITDMLLEIDNSELLQMLESQEILRDKVQEAEQFLKPQKLPTKAQAQNPAQACAARLQAPLPLMQVVLQPMPIPVAMQQHQIVQAAVPLVQEAEQVRTAQSRQTKTQDKTSAQATTARLRAPLAFSEVVVQQMPIPVAMQQHQIVRPAVPQVQEVEQDLKAPNLQTKTQAQNPAQATTARFQAPLSFSEMVLQPMPIPVAKQQQKIVRAAVPQIEEAERVRKAQNLQTKTQAQNPAQGTTARFQAPLPFSEVALQPMPIPVAIQQQKIVRAAVPQGQEQLTSAMLAGQSVSDQKQMIGERLFPLVEEINPSLASKITGMLLEIDNSDLLRMLASLEILEDNVQQAEKILKAQTFQTKEQAKTTAQATTARLRSPLPFSQVLQPMPTPVAMQQHQIVRAAVPQGRETLTSAMLAGKSLNDQKQIIGERLFPLVQECNPSLAAKITGMLLEIDNSELLQMLESREILRDKVHEAEQVLKAQKLQTKTQSGTSTQASAARLRVPIHESQIVQQPMASPGAKQQKYIQRAAIAQVRAPLPFSPVFLQPMPRPGPKQQQKILRAAVPKERESLTSAMLAGMSLNDQKSIIGERLFPLVQDHNLCLAGKITGMLLEIDNSELLHMLQSREALRDKVQEAEQLLKAYMAKQAMVQAQAQVL